MSITYTKFQRKLDTKRVPASQVERRSVDEINRERRAELMGDRASTKPYEFGPFSQFALAHDKTPFQRGWRENLLSGEAIAHHLKCSTYANGIIGIIPAGYVVLDFDGPKAMQCLLGSQKLSRLEPSTVWFSGDPKQGGLPKILYRLPEGMDLPGKKLVQAFADGNAVEILGPGHQITLPGSFHSEERGLYQERGDYPVADAPAWLIELIGAKVTERKQRFDVANLRDVSDGDRSVEKLLLTLDADDYDVWVEVGLSLKAMGDEYLDEFDHWSSTGRKYRGFDEVEKKWSSFKPTKIKNGYAHLCRLAGVRPPTPHKRSEESGTVREQLAASNWVPFLSHQGDDRQYFGGTLANTVDRTLRSGTRSLIIQAGPTGAGKSTSTQKASAVVKRRHTSLIGITPLESSAKGLSGPTRLGVPYRKENLHGADSFACCTNALIPDASNADWAKLTRGDGGVLLLDEASETNQLISGFKAEARVKRETAQALLSTRQIVAAQSATLKQYDVDFYKHLGDFSDGDVIMDAIATTAHPRNIEIYKDSQAKNLLLQEAIEAIKMPGVAVVISSDSQQLNSRWGTMMLEQFLQGQVPGVPITRIDGQTTKDPSHPAYAIAQQSDVYLAPNTITIQSPSVETNLSQHPGEGVTQILWLTLDSGRKTVERIIQDCRARGKEGVAITQKIVLSDFAGSLPHGDAFTPEAVWDDIQLQISNGSAKRFHKAMQGEDLEQADPIVQDYCTRMADEACSLVGKKLIVPRVFEQQGHSVSTGVVQDSDELKNLKHELDECRELAIALWNENISSAPEFTELECEAIERRGTYTQQEWYGLKRFKIERVLGNRLTEKVEAGSIIRCNEGVVLTPELVDTIDRKRLGAGWRRSFDIFTTPYDWAVRSIRKFDGTPSALESASSTFAQMMALEDVGILQFVREHALLDCYSDMSYSEFLNDKKPSQSFQRAMVTRFKSKAFTTKHPALIEIAQQLSGDGVLEKLISITGIRGIKRNNQGMVTPGSVLTIIRRFFNCRTLRSKAVRLGDATGATILSLDDRLNEVYALLLNADKRSLNERDCHVNAIGLASNGVTRSQMFDVWEESRKVSGVRIVQNVPLLQRLEELDLGNRSTNPCKSLAPWIGGLGVELEKPLAVGDNVQRTDVAGWGGIITAIRGTVVDVLFHLEPVARAVPIGCLSINPA